MMFEEPDSLFLLVPTDSSDKLRQPKIGALMKQVMMGNKEDVPGTFSRGGETCLQSVSDLTLHLKTKCANFEIF